MQVTQTLINITAVNNVIFRLLFAKVTNF